MEPVTLLQWNNFAVGILPKYYALDEQRYYSQLDLHFLIWILNFSIEGGLFFVSHLT